MAITALTYAIGNDIAQLQTAVAAGITGGKVPYGPPTYLGGYFLQGMTAGNQSATFEDLDDRTTAAEADVDALQADTTQVSVAVNATVGGGTTGLIPATANYVTATSDQADKQISLPAATIGKVMRILVAGAACELISAVAAHKANDIVVGATNEAALVQDALYTCQYVATNTWIVTGETKLGARIAAIVPDALV